MSGGLCGTRRLLKKVPPVFQAVAALQEEGCLILPAQPLPLELPDG